MNDAWREWSASLERLAEGPFGDVGRSWVDWIRSRLESLTSEDTAASSLFEQGATLVKSMLDSKSESDASDGDALLRQLLRRIEAVEARLDAAAMERNESEAP